MSMALRFDDDDCQTCSHAPDEHVPDSRSGETVCRACPTWASDPDGAAYHAYVGVGDRRTS